MNSTSTWSRTSSTVRRAWRSYSSYTPAPASISSQAEIDHARKYCIDTLAKFDTPSYLLRGYIPRSARDAYLAIRAFNVDVARTADTTSTPTVGAMRLQFQRDGISAALAGTPPKQPILILLAKAAEDIQRRSGGSIKLSRSWLNRLITTREQHLSNPPFTDLGALETYAENTYSTLLYLTLQSMGLTSLTCDHVASHIGKACGIATILKGIPLIAFPEQQRAHSGGGNQQSLPGAVGAQRHGAVLLPLDIMAEHGVREEDVLRQGSGAAGLGDAVFAVATRANDHLITAREMVRSIRAGQGEGHAFEHADDGEHGGKGGDEEGLEKVTPAQELERAFGALLPIVPTALWLDRLQGVDFDMFSLKLRATDWRLPFKAWWSYTTRRL